MNGTLLYQEVIWERTNLFCSDFSYASFSHLHNMSGT